MSFKKYLFIVRKLPFFEVLIIFIYILIINNYLGNPDQRIKADGTGYYDYLPSIFIYHDIVRKDVPYRDGISLYDRIGKMGVYIDYEEFKVNKYPCGTAILQLPFFLYSYYIKNVESESVTGYERYFHVSIFHAAIFYLGLSLIFLRRILSLFRINRGIIVLIQTLLVLATPVTNYANFDAGFSHIYSLFAISGFVYFAKSFFIRKSFRNYLLSCLFLGLVITIRQVNVLIILSVPFLAGSLENLGTGIRYLWNRPVKLLAGFILVVVIFSPQSIVWYLQVGKPFVYSYQGEGFQFFNPHFFSILFSYKKGFFIYTPVMFIAFLSIIWFIFYRKAYFFITWLGFFLILTYVLSSWWCWYYGASYGLRTYIDFYPILFIPMAIVLNNTSIYLRTGIMAISLLTIPLNIIQTYQYKNFILHWGDMNKEWYWRVFLKTDSRYKGLLFKRKYDFRRYETVKEISLGNQIVLSDGQVKVVEFESRMIPEFNQVNIIQVSFTDDFKRDNDMSIIVGIYKADDNKNLYWHQVPYIHFANEGFDKVQLGSYNYDFTGMIDHENDLKITIKIEPGKINSELRDFKISFLKPVS